MTSDDEPLHQREIREQREVDRLDYNDEIAGRDTGKIPRFYSGLSKNHPNSKAKEKEKEFLSALERMLFNNLKYARLYRAVNSLLQKAETQTEKVLEEVKSTFELEKNILDDLRSSASTLPSGIKVFRDYHGQVWTEDKRPVDAFEAESIVWKGNSPSYEEFLAQKEKVEQAQQSIDELRHYQIDVLGHARDQISNEDSPPTKEELLEIQQKIIEQAPPLLRKELDARPTDKTLTAETFNVAVPSI